MSLNTEQFIFQLVSRFLPELKLTENNLYLYGRQKGWLEDEDERFSQSYITRRAAARIIHQFMKIELKIPDLSDISAAEVLTDLYTCRTCANHIAQVFVRGLMEGEEINGLPRQPRLPRNDIRGQPPVIASEAWQSTLNQGGQTPQFSLIFNHLGLVEEPDFKNMSNILDSLIN